MKRNYLREYAELTVNTGINLQPGQYVEINACIENADLVREIVKVCYKQKAKNVSVLWRDSIVDSLQLKYTAINELKKINNWEEARWIQRVQDLPCKIYIESDPDAFKGVNPKKKAEVDKHIKAYFKRYRDQMDDKYQWTIIAAPTKSWAKKVFPELNASQGIKKLWELILSSVYVNGDNTAIQSWKEKNQTLSKRYTLLNNYNFEYLHFKNSLGTDLTIKLVEGHRWAGGMEKTLKGITYNPNMPTEEVFCMPNKFGTNGKVVGTKPFNYRGLLIEDFYLVFKDGKVVEAYAGKGQDTLDGMLEMDEGARHLGEVALVPFDSPINNSKVMFYETLFDENASCHLALGKSYAMNLRGSENMTREQMNELGSNDSMIHEDFMFGSEDMTVIGTTHDGKEVKIFENGNFVI